MFCTCFWKRKNSQYLDFVSRHKFLLLFQVSKQEKQQQRKEKTRSKGPSESGREKGALRSRQEANASSGAEGDVSSEREN